MELRVLLFLLTKSFISTPWSAEARLSPSGIPHGEIASGDFLPLDCNANLANAECVSWVSKNFDLENSLVTINCGECVTFDEPEGSTVLIPYGLDVIGKLVFPPDTKATIETPFVIVQGELEASSTQPVTTDNIDSLSFVLTGTDPVPFFPHTQNKPSCGDLFCDIGKKPFLVAGGKLNIHGLSDTCPTWVKLIDVVRDASEIVADEYPTLPLPPDGCSREVINDDFTTDSGLFKSSLGCMDTIEQTEDGNNYFHVFDRTRSWQGPFVNADKFLRDCMIPDQPYLVKAKYRLTTEDGSFSNCHANGTDCLAMNIHTMDKDEKMSWRTLFETPAVAKSVDGEWTDFAAEISFKDTDFNATSLYQVLYFSGPEAGVNIDIDDVFLSLPWEEQFPDPNLPGEICNNLLTNGDAELDDLFVYPFKRIGNLGSYLKVESETVGNVTNKFFGIRGRTTGWTSIFQGMIHDCIVANSVYNFKMKIRIHSVDPVTARFVLKSYTDDPAADPNYTYETIGKCPPASAAAGWVWCETNFLFRTQHAEATGIDLQIIIDDDDTADVDYDDFSITLSSPPSNKYILPPSIMECWGVGADIVQTSHTLYHRDYNLVNITEIALNEDGNALVTIGTPVAKPTTLQDDERFAVEVALLSRNIAMFPKDDDPAEPLHGAHLMFLHTKDVVQKLNGVDFRKFGQQGIVARYPVHFHMSGTVEGSVIAKNTVRHSNQRCYVIHGTHNVTVEENIAFDTFGHCYMLEDGIEEHNKFFFNLGLETKITPDAGILSIAESDMFPATFWAANPRNYFLGNVAAGSEDTGFWYEMLEVIRGTSVKLDPSYLVNPTQVPLGYHKQNSMHSNYGDGFKLYPNGYFPEQRALFEDVISFRNVGDGVLLHNSKNLGIERGVFADNRRQIEVDKQADDVTVNDAVVIGFSPLYQIEVQAANRKSHCPAWRPLVGIQLHSFLRYRDSKGYVISNTTFEDFGADIGCVGSSAIEMDEQVRDGHFDAYSSFYNLTFPEGIPDYEKFNMCELEKNPLFLHDLVIQDETGDLNPAGNDLPGVIVSNSTTMTTFSDNCVDMVGSCSLYCEGHLACYRAINIATWNSPEYEDLYLEVTDDSGKTAQFSGYFETLMMPAVGGEIPDEFENTIFTRRRYYSPIVPYGNYTMRFKRRGASYWPQFVELVWEDPPSCDPHIDENTTSLVIPTPTEDECMNVIRNPGGELGSYAFWAHTGGGVKVVEGSPYDENGNPGSTHSGSYAISSTFRRGGWHGIGQYIDTRCFTIGRQYEIIVKMRLQLDDGSYIACNINRVDFNAFDVCPRASFRIRTLLGNKIGDGVDTAYAYPMANAVGPWEADKWNTLYGVFTVTETLAAADSVFFFIERGRPGVNVVIDDVAIQPTIYGCHMPMFNGDFEVGDTRFWNHIGTTEIGIYPNGYNSNYALRTTVRKEFWGSMTQDLTKECLVEGDSFSVSAMMLLLDENDQVYDCDVTLEWGADGMNYICPTVSLRITTGASFVDIDIGNMPGPINQGDWNSVFGQFEVSSSMAQADAVTLFFRKTKANIDFVVDDLKITKVSGEDASIIVQNGDFKSGDLRYFNVNNGGVMDISSPGFDDDYSMLIRQRSSENYGVRYALDNESLTVHALYKVSCQIFLILEDLETFFECDPKAVYGVSRCPIISLRSQKIGAPPMTRPIAAASAVFKKGEWNEFGAIIQLLSSEVTADTLYLVIDKAPPQVVMVIDNISITMPDISSEAPTHSPSTSSMPSNEPSDVPSLRPTRFNETIQE